MQNSTSNLDHAPSHHLWESKPDTKADNLYRLRIWVTHDNEERGDCKCHTFIFKTLDELISATSTLKSSFEKAKSSHKVKNCGVGCIDDEGRVDKGKMEAVAIAYDSTSSEESWTEFRGRLEKLEKGWALDA